TCKQLYLAGFTPISLDNLFRGHKWAVKWGPLVEGDLRDEKLLDQIFQQYQPEAVIHFGALAYVGESVTNPGQYYDNNVTGTLTLLSVMNKHSCSRIIFSSSCSTYGIPNNIPISETCPQSPVNPYGWSKFFVERILQDYDSAYGLKHVALRYFNAAGADPDGETGEVHHPETHLIPLAIQAALGQRPQIDIFGTDYDTPDGSAIRDYIHVTDLASAHLKALELLLSGAASISMNLGTGHGQSVWDVIRTVEEAGHRPVKTRPAPRRPGDPPCLVAAADLARKVLSWQPIYPDLKDIVRTAWRWHDEFSSSV
ncbi:MAG: UDP-glucose 4-epimerase GalE, partial [Deltaproteobacteria bacterium]|nr:UDP-glucose 4-epimerase GalE [Deltaproteobacteria bacterium]